MSHQQNAGQEHIIMTVNQAFENETTLKYLALTSQIKTACIKKTKAD
jgi:hypothetical protein